MFLLQVGHPDGCTHCSLAMSSGLLWEPLLKAQVCWTHGPLAIPESAMWLQADGAPVSGLVSLREEVRLPLHAREVKSGPGRLSLLAGLTVFMDHDPDSCHTGPFRDPGSYEGSDSLARKSPQWEQDHQGVPWQHCQALPSLCGTCRGLWTSKAWGPRAWSHYSSKEWGLR